MLERFTHRAQTVVVQAREEARTRHHDRIGTGHLLVALAGEGRGVAAMALGLLGTTSEDVQRQMSGAVGPGPQPRPEQVPFTPRAEGVLARSLPEAHELGSRYVGTEHVLLSLVHEDGGGAARILSGLGLDRDRVRREVLQLLSGSR